MSRLYPCVYCTEDGYCEKYSDEEVTSWCVQSPCKDEKPSNADRIRAMTDEELAEFMCHNVSNGTVNCAFCAAAEFCRMGHNGWLDWLKEVADDGEAESN